MKRMPKIYQRYVHLHICPPIKSISILEKSLNVFITILCPTVLLILWFSSFMVIKKYISIDLAIAIGACYQLTAVSNSLYTFFTSHVKRNDLEATFDVFQKFYDTSKLLKFYAIKSSKFIALN